MPSILLIEDTDAVRALFRTILEESGYIVREASQGLDGIRQFRQSPTDVVITDIYMPDCDGLEVIVTLRREFPRVKILATSGRGGQQEMLTVSELWARTRFCRNPLREKPCSKPSRNSSATGKGSVPASNRAPVWTGRNAVGDLIRAGEE